MSGVAVNFSMDMRGIRRSVRRAARRIADTRTVGEEIGEMLVSSTKERFETSQAPDGKAWKPSQRAERDGGKTLVDSGTLLGSIFYEVSAAAVAVGSNLVYARPHQEGMDISVLSSRRRITLPARPYLGFSDDDIGEARAILEKHIARGFSG